MMKMQIEVPVIAHEKGWYKEKGQITIEWMGDSPLEGINYLKEETEKALTLLNADGRLMTELECLTREIKEKKTKIQELDSEIQSRERKMNILDKALKFFGVSPHHYEVIMDLQKLGSLEAAIVEDDDIL